MDAVTLVNHFNLYLKICKEIEMRGYADTICVEFYQMVTRFGGGDTDMRSKVMIKRKHKEEKDEVLEFYMRENHGTCIQTFVNETIAEEIYNQKLFNLFYEIIKDNVTTCTNKTRCYVEDGDVYHHLGVDVTF